MIGVLGFDCSNKSWRQILEMYLSKMQTQWGQTSSIVAMIYNTNAKKPKNPSAFDPFSKTEKNTITVTPDDMDFLGAAIVGRKRGE